MRIFRIKKYSVLVFFLLIPITFAANWITCEDVLGCGVCSDGIDVPAYGGSVSCGFGSCSDNQFCCRIPFWIDSCISIKDAYEVKCPASTGSCKCDIDTSPSLDCSAYGCASGTPAISLMCKCTIERACMKDENGLEYSLYDFKPFNGKFTPGGYPNYDVDPRCKANNRTYCRCGCDLTTGYCKPCKNPDLTITDLSISSDGKTVSYTVKNIGDVDAPESTTYIYINGELQSYHNTEPSLSPGSSHSNSFTLSTALSTGDTVKVCADCSGEIKEKAENNNCEELTYNKSTDTDGGEKYKVNLHLSQRKLH